MYVNDKTFAFLGLIVNFTATGLIIYLTYQDLKDPNNKYVIKPYVPFAKIRKSFVLEMILFGSLPSFLMPLYTFDYYSCVHRNKVYLMGGFPVYFSRIIVILIIIISGIIIILKFLLEKGLLNKIQFLNKPQIE